MAKQLVQAEREAIWADFRRGFSLRAIGRVSGRDESTVRVLVKQRGGVAPHPATRAGRVLSFEDREVISRGLATGRTLRNIANELGRAPSTVTREVARHGGRGDYRAVAADEAAWRAAKRPKRCLLETRPELCEAVSQRLMQDWSPRQIASTLRREHPGRPDMRVSHETIYQSLFIQARNVLKKELISHLRSKRTMRRSKNAPAVPQGRGQIKDLVSIRERPAEVEDRAVPGHWEGDLLCGGYSSQIATLVERRTRYVILVKIPSKDSRTVASALIEMVKTLPLHLWQTLTWDRGSEMADHVRFTIATDVKVYFCDPRSPWQRGSNENTNGLLRQYLPKDSDLGMLEQWELDEIAKRLNTRPRMTLDWKTPAVALAQCVATTV